MALFIFVEALSKRLRHGALGVPCARPEGLVHGARNLPVISPTYLGTRRSPVASSDLFILKALEIDDLKISKRPKNLMNATL